MKHSVIALFLLACATIAIAQACYNHQTCEACNADGPCGWCSTYSSFGYCVSNSTECGSQSFVDQSAQCTPFCQAAPVAKICEIPTGQKIRNNGQQCQNANANAYFPGAGDNCTVAIHNDGQQCWSAIATHDCSTACSPCPDPMTYKDDASLPRYPTKAVCQAIRSACVTAALIEGCAERWQCADSNTVPTINAHLDGFTAASSSSSSSSLAPSSTIEEETSSSEEEIESTSATKESLISASLRSGSSTQGTIPSGISLTSSPSKSSAARSSINQSVSASKTAKSSTRGSLKSSESSKPTVATPRTRTVPSSPIVDESSNAVTIATSALLIVALIFSAM
eukprot:TRINITY_DN13321_c0_g1_i2.p1 TRINITY_DN13321_c0_g1~~TRINITY_DN13321_c0_g1_i2.p1  ORF type:complete len:339 (-),score=67.56 TRINITY_DN13321_c0_g1_i2:36-1052(-)